MTVIGLVLILIAVLVLLAALLGGSDDQAVLDLGIFDVSTSTMGVFLIGAATVLIFVSGLELLRSGLRRSLRRRRELKNARAAVAEQDRREGTTSDREATDTSGSATASTDTGTTGTTGTTATDTRTDPDASSPPPER